MIFFKPLVTSVFIWFTATQLLAVSEEQIKSAYLERFAMFIEWPQPIKQYNVCVYNDNLFAQNLEKTYASKSFNSRPLKVVSLNAGSSSDEMNGCHILYYRGSKPRQNSDQLNSLQKNHVLTISDDENDPKKGAIIGFYLQNNSYRFVINQRNLEDSELSASYKLLNFATLLEATGGKNGTK